MEIVTGNELESTGFRCLFECIKQKGIEPVFELAQDIEKLPNKNILLRQALISNEKNDLTKLVEKNEDVISYLREHKKELSKFSFTKKGTLNTIKNLSENNELLDTYLENARKLEQLKVADVKFVRKCEWSYYHGIYRDEDGNIINIEKYYTDGNIITHDETLQNKTLRYSVIPFYITDATFLLESNNTEDFCQYRGIQISDFSFDGSSLPTEEEIQSYELPKRLLKK